MHTASRWPLGRQHFPLKFINSTKAAPQVVDYHSPPPGPLSVSRLDFLALVFLLWFFPCTACRGVLTRLTFLSKEPKQGCVQEILQCHQPSLGRDANSLHFPLNVIITFVQTLSFHVHWEPWLKTYKWLFCRWFSEGPTVEFHSLIYVTLKASWTQQTFF